MRALISSLCVLLTACGEDPPVDTDVVDSDPPAAVGTTYHADVRELLDARCGACHTPGGPAPFDVHYRAEDWADGAPVWAAPAVASALAGTMPPWPASQDCTPIEHPRVLSDDELSVLRAWADNGYAEGDPADAPLPPDVVVDDLGEPDVVLRADEAYAADPASPDDYRCLVVDAAAADAWVHAVTVVPDQTRVLHHVILYGLDERWADDVAAWDAGDDGPGYTCFGSPGTWDADTIAGWAPGQAPEVYGEGMARHISEGTVLVLQVHYNTVGLEPADIPADQTAVHLWTLPEGEKPALEVLSVPVPDTELDIQPGDPDVVETSEISLDELGLRRQIRTIGAFPHMHKLGTSIRLEAVREDDTTTCLIDVPSWDFAWQQAYFFDTPAPLVLSRSDRLRLTCTYDNSVANQPIENGVPREPQQVGWGEGTYDEMCLVYMYVTLPVGSGPGGTDLPGQ